MLGEGHLYRLDDVFYLQGPNQVVAGTGHYGLPGRLGVRTPGVGDDGRLRQKIRQRRDSLECALGGLLDADEDYLGPQLRGEGEGLGTVVNSAHHDEAGTDQPLLQLGSAFEVLIYH